MTPLLETLVRTLKVVLLLSPCYAVALFVVFRLGWGFDSWWQGGNSIILVSPLVFFIAIYLDQKNG